MCLIFKALADFIEVVADSLYILGRHYLMDVPDFVRGNDVDHAHPLERLKQHQRVKRKCHQVY
jgi:hypothetical protein